VAIKVPRPERVAQPADADGYLAEARTLARLDHPNIVPVHDVGRTEDGLPFVVSKFIEGTDLAATMRQSRPSCTATAAWVLQTGTCHLEERVYNHTRVHLSGNAAICHPKEPHVGNISDLYRRFKDKKREYETALHAPANLEYELRKQRGKMEGELHDLDKLKDKLPKQEYDKEVAKYWTLKRAQLRDLLNQIEEAPKNLLKVENQILALMVEIGRAIDAKERVWNPSKKAKYDKIKQKMQAFHGQMEA
jgi:hypothetical protein